MSSRESSCKSPDLANSFKMSTLAEVRREVGGGSVGLKSPHGTDHQGLLSRDSSSYLAGYSNRTADHKQHKSTSEQLRPSYSSEDYSSSGSFPTKSSHHTSNHHRQQYKLVLEEKQQSPDLHSNCSSTSPPAPAQVAPSISSSGQPRPGSMSYSNNNINASSHLARSLASKVLPFHENDPFSHSKHAGDNDEKLLPRRATNSSKTSALSPLLSTSTTNGWQQEKEKHESRYNGSNGNDKNSTSLANFTAASSLFSKRHDILLSALDFLSPTSATSATNLPATSSVPLPAAASSSSTSGGGNQHKQHGHSPVSQSLSPMPIGAEPLAQLLITLKEQNKSLIREIEDLRIKLADAEGDLKLVRCQMRSMSKNMDSLVLESNRDRLVDETILGDLEYYKEKVKMMERDIQSLLDEKDELAEERDELTLKNERLNERLLLTTTTMRQQQQSSTAQADGNGASSSFDDATDALYLENRYLKEKIKSEESERRLLLERLAKYKELMEEHQRANDAAVAGVQSTSPKKKYGIGANNSAATVLNESFDPTATGTTSLTLPGGRVVSAREVERLISAESIHSMEVNKSNQMYLWNLLVALFEGLQTKDINLVRAKKTNRLLVRQVEELMFGGHGSYPDFTDFTDAYDSPTSISRQSPALARKQNSKRIPSSNKSPLKVRSVRESGLPECSTTASTTARSTPSSVLCLREQHDDLFTPDLDLGGVDLTDSVTIASSVTSTTVKETSEEEEEVENGENDELSTTPSTSIDARLHMLEKDLQALDYMHSVSNARRTTTSTASGNSHNHHRHHHHHHQPFYDSPPPLALTYSATSSRDHSREPHSYGDHHHSMMLTGCSSSSAHKSPTSAGNFYR